MTTKKRIHLMIMLIVISLVSLCGCRRSANSNNNTNITYGFNSYGENGMIIYEDGLLAYYDYKTGERSVVCSRPDCTHQKYNSETNPDPSCAAVPPVQTIFQTAVIINDQLYMFVLPSGINIMDVYRSDLDGENRVKIGQINCGGIVDKAIVYNDFLVFTGENFVKKDNNDMLSGSAFQTRYFTGILNINTLELIYRDEFEKNRTLQHYYVYNNTLHYYYMDDNVYEIRRVDLSDFSVLEPLSLPMKNNQEKVFCVIDKGFMYYVTDNPTQTTADIRRIDLMSMKEEVFASDIYIWKGTLLGINDNYFFIHCYENTDEGEVWKYKVYDSDTKTINECDMFYSEVRTGLAVQLINISKDYILLYKVNEDSQHMSYRYMKIESLINKSYDFVDIDIIY